MSRIAIVVVFPELVSIVDTWRLKCVDVAIKGVPPHVTQLFPWKEAPIRDGDIQAVSELCTGTMPFNIEFHELSYFECGTIYLVPTDNQLITGLSKKSWATFPETPPYAGMHKDSIPHLTVAQADSQTIASLFADVSQDLAGALPCSFQVSEITILEESSLGQSTIRVKLPFLA